MKDHVTCVVSDEVIGVCCGIVYQSVAFVDRVGCRFVLLSGDLVQGGYHGGIN